MPPDRCGRCLSLYANRRFEKSIILQIGVILQIGALRQVSQCKTKLSERGRELLYGDLGILRALSL